MFLFFTKFANSKVAFCSCLTILAFKFKPFVQFVSDPGVWISACWKCAWSFARSVSLCSCLLTFGLCILVPYTVYSLDDDASGASGRGGRDWAGPGLAPQHSQVLAARYDRGGGVRVVAWGRASGRESWAGPRVPLREWVIWRERLAHSLFSILNRAPGRPTFFFLFASDCTKSSAGETYCVWWLL